MFKKLFLVCFTIVLSACAVDAETSDDQAIMDLVYNDKRVPEGFYQEEVPNDAFYATGHIKNTEVGQTTESPYELSTDDYYIAAQWDTQATQNVYGSYAQLIEITETDLYYQFTHMHSDNDEFIRRARVFKSTIIDRAGATLNCESCYKGKVNTDWLTLENATFIIEYLWTFTLENNYGNSIFHASVEDHGEGYIYAMLRAELTRDYTGNTCDEIKVYLHSYGISKLTGEIHKDTLLLKTIYSQLNDRTPTTCKK